MALTKFIWWNQKRKIETVDEKLGKKRKDRRNSN